MLSMSRAKSKVLSVEYRKDGTVYYKIPQSQTFDLRYFCTQDIFALRNFCLTSFLLFDIFVFRNFCISTFLSHHDILTWNQAIAMKLIYLQEASK